MNILLNICTDKLNKRNVNLFVEGKNDDIVSMWSSACAGKMERNRELLTIIDL
jgi:hypothetical protein